MLAKEKNRGKKNTAHMYGDHAPPDHSVHLKNLRKIKGQVEGIEKMITDGRYCPDIINQVKAATAALKSVEAKIFKAHLSACVQSAFSSSDPFDSERKIQEIVKIAYS